MRTLSMSSFSLFVRSGATLAVTLAVLFASPGFAVAEGQDLAREDEPTAQVALELISVTKVSDSAPHSAFTDLIWRDGFYCVFREGARHVSEEADIRVMFSDGGKEWESLAVLSAKGYDLRDAKISLTPSGQLMLLCGAAVREGSGPATNHRNFVYISEDGRDWDGPREVARENTWLWRLTWHGDAAYGIGYEVSPESRAEKRYGTSLWRGGKDGSFELLKESLFTENGPTEGTLRFAADGTLFCLQRRDGRPINTAVLGESKPPYADWSWRDLGHYYGGPELIAVSLRESANDSADNNSGVNASKEIWLAGGRLKVPDKGSRTVLCELDVDNAKLIPLLELPSDGDTSYPGFVVRGEKLFVSYYSSHEGKTSIYFAEVKIKGRE